MATLMMVNPRKRRKTHKRRAHNPTHRAKRRTTRHKKRAHTSHRAHRRHNPAHRVHRRHKRRRNPAMSSATIMADLKTAFTEAAGGLILDMVYANVPLPAMLESGTMKYVGKLAIAVGLGYAGKSIMGKKPMVNSMVRGAMTVTMHDFLKSMAGTAMPSLNLGGGMDVIDESAFSLHNPAAGLSGIGTGVLPGSAGVLPAMGTLGTPIGAPMHGYEELDSSYSGNY